LIGGSSPFSAGVLNRSRPFLEARPNKRANRNFRNERTAIAEFFENPAFIGTICSSTNLNNRDRKKLAALLVRRYLELTGAKFHFPDIEADITADDRTVYCGCGLSVTS
jgi:hypothetical protein